MKPSSWLVLALLPLFASCSTPAPQRAVRVQPVVIVQTPAVYPAALRGQKIGGEAVVEFIVTKDGDVVQPRVVSATHREFGEAAAITVMKWKFNPGTLNGRPVPYRMHCPVVFVPDNASPQEKSNPAEPALPVVPPSAPSQSASR